MPLSIITFSISLARKKQTFRSGSHPHRNTHKVWQICHMLSPSQSLKGVLMSVFKVLQESQRIKNPEQIDHQGENISWEALKETTSALHICVWYEGHFVFTALPKKNKHQKFIPDLGDKNEIGRGVRIMFSEKISYAVARFGGWTVWFFILAYFLYEVLKY